MFMVRGSAGRLEEMGRVYIYLQRAPLNLKLSLPHLTGTQVYGRFGNTIAPMGDLNQDGFNGKYSLRPRCTIFCYIQFCLLLANVCVYLNFSDQQLLLTLIAHLHPSSSFCSTSEFKQYMGLH